MKIWMLSACVFVLCAATTAQAQGPPKLGQHSDCQCIWEGGVTHTLKALHKHDNTLFIEISLKRTPCCKPSSTEMRLVQLDGDGQVQDVKALPKGAEAIAFASGNPTLNLRLGKSVVLLQLKATVSVNKETLEIGTVKVGVVSKPIVLVLKPVVLSKTPICNIGGKAWTACAGERVRIEGRAPKGVRQHPMINGLDEHQSYMDAVPFDGTQFVVTTRAAPPACTGAMVATGKLHRIDLGGKIGKGSYKGWAIQQATLVCKP